MGQPFPPQGNQSQHTERPLRVYAEQYLEGGTLPIGVSVAPVAMPPGDTSPRVALPYGEIRVIQSTEWVISSRYTGAPIEVISDEEFTERFGPSGGPTPV
jgi:hypothetical protein